MIEFKLEDIRVLKLSTGEVILGFYETIEEEQAKAESMQGYIIVRHPYQIAYDIAEDTKNDTDLRFKISCFRWLPFIQDDSLLLQKASIMGIALPEDEILVSYSDLLHAQFSENVEDGQEH